MTPQDREKGQRWLRGERIDELAFLYNSLVEMSLPDGEKKEGWIVSADIVSGRPIYTVEARDDTGDYEVPEEAIFAIPPQKAHD